jgi:hypothetical protein
MLSDLVQSYLDCPALDEMGSLISDISGLQFSSVSQRTFSTSVNRGLQQQPNAIQPVGGIFFSNEPKRKQSCLSNSKTMG